MSTPIAFACRELRLRQFRNLSDVTLTFPPEGVAVTGDNGAGKTNLLEALHYLEIFRSFRGSPDDRLVRFGTEGFHLRALFRDGGSGAETEIVAAWDARSRRKRVTVDGAEPERLGDAIGHVGVVVFAPTDVALVAGPPVERRRYLDILLSLGERQYFEALQRYRRVLRHRNALLRRGASTREIQPWSDALALAGGHLSSTRAQWVEAQAPAFGAHDRDIGGGQGARLAYRCGSTRERRPSTDAAEASDALAAELARVAPKERVRGQTLAGPHRDDLAILAGNGTADVHVREFGSGGQMRTAAIALRLVEADYVRASRGRAPIVLLDDVFAELDAGRSSRILETLQSCARGQVILTAPKESDVALRREGGFLATLARWRIRAGSIET